MQSWNIVITSPWQVVTAIVAVATAFTAIDKAWDTLLAKWKKHKAPEEAQNAEISALKTQIQQITPRLDAVEGQLTAMITSVMMVFTLSSAARFFQKSCTGEVLVVVSLVEVIFLLSMIYPPYSVSMRIGSALARL